jgi:hypothetical protein
VLSLSRPPAKIYEMYRFVGTDRRNGGGRSWKPSRPHDPTLEIAIPVRNGPKGRLRHGGCGRHVQQYKLHAESIDKKLAVLARLQRSGDMKATVAHFYPNLADKSYQSKRVQILRWRREQTKLEEAACAHKGALMKLREVGTSTILCKEIEESIVVWVNQLQDEGVPVSVQMLTVNARELAEAADINDRQCEDESSDFEYIIEEAIV